MSFARRIRSVIRLVRIGLFVWSGLILAGCTEGLIEALDGVEGASHLPLMLNLKLGGSSEAVWAAIDGQPQLLKQALDAGSVPATVETARPR